MSESDFKMAFFGSSDFSVSVLEELRKAGFTPELIVTAPDSRQGRGMKFTSPSVKVWVLETPGDEVEILQPVRLDKDAIDRIQNAGAAMFTVASYGRLLPENLLKIPKYGTLNVHPSLLPKYRGANPIAHQILSGEETVGVTIMLVDEKMDHGPILAQREFPAAAAGGGGMPRADKLREFLAHKGGALLAEAIPKWMSGKISPRKQDHDKATFAPKIKKEDGLINPKGDPDENDRKFRAYFPWPGTFFFKNGKRVKITDAQLVGGYFIINKVIPEGKKEMAYEDFLRG